MLDASLTVLALVLGSLSLYGIYLFFKLILSPAKKKSLLYLIIDICSLIVLAIIQDKMNQVKLEHDYKAERAQRPVTQQISKKPTVIADKSQMVLISAGEFTMGATAEEGLDDDQPQHKVYLDAFYIDKYDVTTKQYAACVDAKKCAPPLTDAEMMRGIPPDVSKSIRKSNCNWGKQEHGNYPVNCITWFQANTYCESLGKRLPTEAEWEKAARGGTETAWSFGNDVKDVSQYAWCAHNEREQQIGHSHPVGLKKPNLYGLYDMHGNVGQWVSDWYWDKYYSESPNKNPQGPEQGKDSLGNFRVIRGGNAIALCIATKSATRSQDVPNATNDVTGFRCASH